MSAVVGDQVTQALDNSCWDERSWQIWLIAECERAGIVSRQGSRFPAIPRDRVSELFDAVQERACAPVRADGTFPAGAFRHADLALVPGFLSEVLFNALREHKRRRFDRTVADGESVLPFLPDGTADLSEVVHSRHALDLIAEQAGALADEVKAYMWADEAGVKRSEILAGSGWSSRKLRAVRRELDDFRARARAAVAVALPLPLLHGLVKMRGAGAGAAGSGGATKALLACGAAATAAACGVGAVVLADSPERRRPAPAIERVATASPTATATAIATVASARATATATPARQRRRTAAAPRKRRATPTATPRPAAVSRPAALTAQVREPEPPTAKQPDSTEFNQEFTP